MATFRPSAQELPGDLLAHVAARPGDDGSLVTQAHCQASETHASATFFAAYADELAVSPRDFAVLLQTLIMGLLQQSILTPGDVSVDLIRNAFRLLGEGAKRAPAQT